MQGYTANYKEKKKKSLINLANIFFSELPSANKAKFGD